MNMILTADISFSNLHADHGIIVVVGYLVCFICLTILWTVFYNLPVILNINIRKWFKKKEAPEPAPVMLNQLTGEEAAAIAAALTLFVEDLHDEERRVLTIQRISRRYSPWSSKIYSVTNGLNKRF